MLSPKQRSLLDAMGGGAVLWRFGPLSRYCWLKTPQGRETVHLRTVLALEDHGLIEYRSGVAPMFQPFYVLTDDGCIVAAACPTAAVAQNEG